MKNMERDIRRFASLHAKHILNALRRIQPRFLASHSRYGIPAGVRNLGIDNEAPGKVVPDIHVVFPAWEPLRNLPSGLGDWQRIDSFQRELAHPQPAAAAVALKEGRLLGKEGIAFDADGNLIADCAKRIAGATYEWRELYIPIRPRPKRLNGTWGALTGCGSSGFFHWLMDVLPKVALIEAVVPQIDGWLVPKCECPFIEQSLDLLQVPQSSRYRISDGEQVIADTLVVASNPAKSGNPPRWVVDFLRTRVAPPRMGAEGGARIYVSRTRANARRIRNESQLLRLLTPLGFTVVHLESLSLYEQAKLFQTASHIVAAHGAGLSNLVHVDPGTRVLELFGEKYVNVCFWALSNHLDLQYSYVVGTSCGDLSGLGTSADIELTERDLRLITEWGKNSH